MRSVTSYPLHAHLILTAPERVEAGLERVRRAGIIEDVPNLFQIELGVVRMWMRVLFRSETVGTSHGASPRKTLRARMLERRGLRFPFLVREQAIAPLDHSGLVSTPERVMKHLLAAHHDRNQFSYDLEMLALEPGRLEALRERAREVVTSDDARARWLKDLTVYEGYHENLLDAVTRAARGDFALPEPDASDPDVSFRAYMRWCARQPRDTRALLDALRRGTLDLGAYRPIHRLTDVPSVEAFRAMSRSELFERLEHGHPVPLEKVAGQAYRGTSLGVPHALEKATWTTFQKAFVRDEARGLVRGFNVRVEQRGLGAPSTPMMKRGRPFTFGHFEVRAPRPGEIPVPAQNALVLDYAGLPRANPIGLRALRDPVVALVPGSADVLLGWSFLDVAGTAVGTPSFFLLEREGAVAYVPEPA